MRLSESPKKFQNLGVKQSNEMSFEHLTFNNVRHLWQHL